MPRKGSRKVRTGCLTCKARKVKCDETKPHCSRCTSTGRACDGYATPNHGSSGTQGARLVWRRPRQLFHGVGSAAESRALQFFCEIAGPFLPGVTDPYFWTQLVMQFSSFEPAVRHSVVAISSLYEQSQTGSASGVQLRDNELALRHYNAAIAELKTMDNPPLVLLVCILFICIEFLQSNRDSAIRHCKHGIYILRNNASTGPAWVREHLVPLFRRLSVFPFFFGTGADDFPSLVSLSDPVPEAFATYSDARFMMDDVFSRAIRLVRCGDVYRFGRLRYARVLPSLLAEQEQINRCLDQWQMLFSRLDAESGSPNTGAMIQLDLDEEYLKSILRVYLSISYEICRILANHAFSAHETNYDRCLDGFRRLLQQFMLLNTTLPAESRKHKHYPKFIFEMGFMPMTHFFIMKCRALDVRLAALKLMRLFSVPRENLWEVDIAWEVARRVIEIEHDLLIDRLGEPLTPPSYPGLPPEEVRVRDMRTDYKLSVQTDARGRAVHGRIINYFMRTPEDTLYTHSEFYPMASHNDNLAPWEGLRETWNRKMELEVRTPSAKSSPPAA